MVTHSCFLAWRIPWTEEPGRLQSLGLQSQTELSMHAHTHHVIWGVFNTPVFLPGESQGRGRKELDTTEVT